MPATTCRHGPPRTAAASAALTRAVLTCSSLATAATIASWPCRSSAALEPAGATSWRHPGPAWRAGLAARLCLACDERGVQLLGADAERTGSRRERRRRRVGMARREQRLERRADPGRADVQLPGHRRHDRVVARLLAGGHGLCGGAGLGACRRRYRGGAARGESRGDRCGGGNHPGSVAHANPPRVCGLHPREPGGTQAGRRSSLSRPKKQRRRQTRPSACAAPRRGPTPAAVRAGRRGWLSGCEVKRFGMGPAVVLGQDLTEVARTVGDGTVADLAAGNRKLGNGHRETAGR